MKKRPLRAFPSLPRSVLGILFLAFGLFLCSDFTARAHVADGLTSPLFQDIVEGDWLDAVSERQRSPETASEGGPQIDRFDAVDAHHPQTLVDARRNWDRLDAALARAGTASLGASSETLSGNNGRPSPRHARGTSVPSSAEASPQAALTAAPPAIPPLAAAPVALPIGTPLCYLPAARGLVIFSLPPPLC